MAERRLRLTGPGTRIAVLRLERELLQQEVDHLGRAVGGGLEPHRGAVAALGQFALERAAQVVDFFLVDDTGRCCASARNW